MLLRSRLLSPSLRGPPGRPLPQFSGSEPGFPESHRSPDSRLSFGSSSTRCLALRQVVGARGHVTRPRCADERARVTGSGAAKP